jgi:hypothetical protein
MAAASPGKDYGASFFENSSEKGEYFLKNFHSARGATHGHLLVESGAGNYYNYMGMLGSIFVDGSSRRMSTGEVVAKQVARSVASQVGGQLGKALVRGILGSMRR